MNDERSAGGSAAHPTLDVLADSTEGLLSDVRLAEVERHVRGCSTCASRLADLSAVTLALAATAESAGDPGPMPAAVADRLHLALQQASDERAASLGPAIDQAAAAAAPRVISDARPPRPGPFGRLADALPARPWRWDRLLVAAAAVSAVALIGPQLINLGGQDQVAAGGSDAGSAASTAEDSATDGGGAAEAPQLAPTPNLARRQPSDDELRILAGRIVATATGKTSGAGGGTDESTLPANCGAQAARELGARLVGTADTAGQVLVVTQSQGSYRYNLLPACDSSASQSLADGVVPTP